MTHAKLLGLALAGTAFALLAAPHAEATPIAYTFQVTISSGPLAPETINGSFAFDSSSVVPNGTNYATGLLTDLDFTLNGVTYTAATANAPFLTFDSAGNLTYFTLGTDCSWIVCSLPLGANEWAMDVDPGIAFFRYMIAGGSSVGGGDVAVTKATAVPEPGSLALLATALVGFGIVGLGLPPTYLRLRRSSGRAAIPPAERGSSRNAEAPNASLQTLFLWETPHAASLLNPLPLGEGRVRVFLSSLGPRINLPCPRPARPPPVQPTGRAS